MKKMSVVGIGAMNMDQLYLVRRIVTDGEEPVEHAVCAPGGSAANTVYALARLGITTGFIGAVGDDETGRILIKDFDSAGVDTSRIRVKRDAATGTVLGIIDGTGHRALYVSPGANRALSMNDIEINYLNGADIVHVSSFANKEQLDVLKQAVSLLPSSIRLSFAPGEIYARKGLAAMMAILKKTHILFVNDSELEQLTGEKLEKGARICLEQGCKVIAVTLGKGVTRKGKKFVSYLTNGEQECLIESPGRTKVVDATGAGDAFAAGMLYGLLKTISLRECGLLGDIMARLSLSKMGARGGLPALVELKEAYRKRTGIILRV